MALHCRNCNTIAKPCEQSSDDPAWRTPCLKIQGWTKSPNKGGAWRCRVCTLLHCQAPGRPDNYPWCWYEGHPVNPKWAAHFGGADEQEELQELPGLQPPPPPPLAQSAGSTPPSPPPPFSPTPPPPPPPFSQQMPGLQPPPMPPLPENAGAQLFTVEFLNAVALHRRMIREWGEPYSEQLDKYMTAAGLVNISDWDTMPSALSGTPVQSSIHRTSLRQRMDVSRHLHCKARCAIAVQKAETYGKTS